MADILWRHAMGVALWELNGTNKVLDQVISSIGKRLGAEVMAA